MTDSHCPYEHEQKLSFWLLKNMLLWKRKLYKVIRVCLSTDTLDEKFRQKADYKTNTGKYSIRKSISLQITKKQMCFSKENHNSFVFLIRLLLWHDIVTNKSLWKFYEKAFYEKTKVAMFKMILLVQNNEKLTEEKKSAKTSNYYKKYCQEI